MDFDGQDLGNIYTFFFKSRFSLYVYNIDKLKQPKEQAGKEQSTKNAKPKQISVIVDLGSEAYEFHINELSFKKWKLNLKILDKLLDLCLALRLNQCLAPV